MYIFNNTYILTTSTLFGIPVLRSAHAHASYIPMPHHEHFLMLFLESFLRITSNDIIHLIVCFSARTQYMRSLYPRVFQCQFFLFQIFPENSLVGRKLGKIIVKIRKLNKLSAFVFCLLHQLFAIQLANRKHLVSHQSLFNRNSRMACL